MEKFELAKLDLMVAAIKELLNVIYCLASGGASEDDASDGDWKFTGSWWS